MNEKRTIRLTGPAQRAFAAKCINDAPTGFVCSIRGENRSDAQNRKMWPMIKDMRDQIEGMDAFTPEQTKLRFLHALDSEMQFLPELEGGGMFVVGQRSSLLTKTQFRDLIELLYLHGSKYEVQWSRKAQDTIDEFID